MALRCVYEGVGNRGAVPPAKEVEVSRRIFVGALSSANVADMLDVASASARQEHDPYDVGTGDTTATIGEATTPVDAYTEGIVDLTLTAGHPVSSKFGDSSEKPEKEPEGRSDHGRSEGEHEGSGPPDSASSEAQGPRLECITTSLTTGAKLAYAHTSVGHAGAERSLLILAA